MKEFTIRTEMCIGEQGITMLKNSTVIVFGTGGVGGHCIEALARSGIGRIILIDSASISESNMNRQIIATKKTVGMKKTMAFSNRLSEISDCSVCVKDIFALPNNLSECFPDEKIDFIADAIDTVSTKIALAKYSFDKKIPIISCMGMGNRLNPTLIRTGDLFSVTDCKLARVMRHELKALGITSLPVVYSLEAPQKPLFDMSDSSKKYVPGSVAFVPSVAGLVMAGYIVNSLIKKDK